MKKNWKRLTALGLCLCLGLSACGDKASSGGGQETNRASAAGTGTENGVASLTQELGYGYLAEYTTLEDLDLNYVASADVAGGKLYLRGDYYDDVTYESGTRLYERDMETGAMQEIPMPELLKTENTNEYIQYMSMMPDGSGYWIVTNQYTFDSALEDGPVEAFETTEDGAETQEEPTQTEDDETAASYQVRFLADTEPLEEEPEEAAEESESDKIAPGDPDTSSSSERYFAKKCDMNGNVLLEIDLSQVTKDMEYFYCQSMVQDRDGTLYLACDETILCFDANGNRLDDVNTGEMYVQSMAAAGDGSVLVSGWDDSMRIFRLESGGLTPLEVDGLSTNGRCDMYTGDGGTVLINDGTLLSSLDVSTGTLTKLLSWLDSDINGNNVNAIAAVDEDTVLVMLSSYQRASSDFLFELGTLKKVPASEIPVRTILTLGAEYLDSEVQDAIIRFNRNSDTYRISLVDYSAYNTEDDYEAGAKQMDRDIVSGAGPDILYMNSLGHVDKYISKGALADLTPLMEQDPDFSIDNLVAGPMRAYLRDGKYYGLPWSFTVNTVYASAALVGERDSWTMQEMQEIVAGLDEDVKVMMWSTQADFLSFMVYYNMNQFVDYGNATCNFESDDFKSLLEIAKRLPQDYSDSDSGDGAAMAYSDSDEFAMLQSGDLLMVTGYGGDGSYEIKRMYRLYTPERGIVRIGYPTSEGNGAMLMIYNAMAISARCKDMDGAWAFLRTMLSDEVQENIWSLPVSRRAFDKVLEEAMKQESYTDENGETVYVDSIAYLGNTEYKIGELTQEQADAFRAYVDGAAIAGNYDSDIMEIIADEAAAYFAGDKSAEETAKLIQSRVSIYLGETS